MIRPAYWTDADLHTRLTAEIREFYIGLWMQADDAGYVDWDPVRLGAELYPYRSLAWRKRNVTRWVIALAPHVKVLACERHLVIPSLERHQVVPRPSYPNRRAHEKCPPHVTSHDPTWPHVLEGKEKEGKEKESKEREAAAPRDGLKDRLGPLEAMLAGKP